MPLFKKNKIYPIVFTSSEKKFDISHCIICLESFISDNQTILACGHTFHSKCILTWFEKKLSCPYCKIKFKWQKTKKINTKII